MKHLIFVSTVTGAAGMMPQKGGFDAQEYQMMAEQRQAFAEQQRQARIESLRLAAEERAKEDERKREAREAERERTAAADKQVLREMYAAAAVKSQAAADILLASDTNHSDYQIDSTK